MSSNEKRVISKSIISGLLGVNLLLLILTLIIPGINNSNFFSLLLSEKANTAIRVVILALYIISFIFSFISIIIYINKNKLTFYGCFCFNFIVALVALILDLHFTIFTIAIRVVLLSSIALIIGGFVYFVYLSRKDYECLFCVVDPNNNENLNQEENSIDDNTDLNKNEEKKKKKKKKDDEVIDAEASNVNLDTTTNNEVNQNNQTENMNNPSNDTLIENNVNEGTKEVADQIVKDVKLEGNETSEINENDKRKKKSKKKDSLFAVETPVESQQLNEEDLNNPNEEVDKESVRRDIKNDILEAADENDINVGIGRTKDLNKYFVTLIISVLSLIGSFFAPIYIGTTSLYPFKEFTTDGKSYYTLALTIIYAIVVSISLFYFGWIVIRRRERDKFEQRVASLIRFIFVFSVLYFLFGLTYFLVKVLGGSEKGNTFSFVFPLIMIVVLITNSIIKSKYQKDILFIDNRPIDYTDPSIDEEEAQQIKALERPFPSLELLFADIIFTLLPIVCLFVTLFKVSATGMDTQTIRALDYITKFNQLTEPAYRAISFVLILSGGIIALFFMLYMTTFFGRQKKFYSISTASIILCTCIVSLISMYGLYYKIVQANNKSEIILLIGQFAPEYVIETLESYKVDTYSFVVFICAIVLLMVVLIRNPMKKSAIYDELDDRDLLEARLNATPINNETLGEFIDKRLTKPVPEGPVDPNAPIFPQEQQVEEEIPEEEIPEEEIVVLEDFDACPAFSELDSKVEEYNRALAKRNETKFDNLDLIKLSHFIINYAANSRLHLSYKYEDIAAFIAGLGCAKLTILQGMSGTGKTSLPKIFMEAIFGNCEIIEIESSWREKNELLGFYNEFSKMYTPKKFTQCLYKATLNKDVVTFIVLDEMNLSRIEYYFSDFLSLMENEEDKREIKLSNVKLYNTYENEKHSYVSLKEDHTLKVPANVWFIGTANRDESTFEISDKVYDRAHTMNFNKRAPAIEKYGPEMKPKFMDYKAFKRILEDAKKTYKFDIEKNETIKRVEQLLLPFNISFGNRIYRQIIDFVKVYCSCYPDGKKVEFDAVETILLTKVVMKLENKNIENKELLVHEFEKLRLRRCSEFISKLSED